MTNNLRRNKGFLLRQVECRAYLKKARDGAHIVERDGSYYYCKERVKIKLTEPGDGGEKVYYERKEKSFSGVVVGIKEISITGRLFIGERRDSAGNTLYRFVGKEPVDTETVALVYYGNLRKRWVPVEDIVGCEDGIQMSIDIDYDVKAPRKKPEYIVIEPEEPFFAALSDDDIPF